MSWDSNVQPEFTKLAKTKPLLKKARSKMWDLGILRNSFLQRSSEEAKAGGVVLHLPTTFQPLINIFPQNNCWRARVGGGKTFFGHAIAH